MPTQEAIEIMREVMLAGEWVLPAEAREDLRWLTLSFASNYEWRPERIIGLEQRLSLDLLCPDGKMRTLTGQPDALLADPPNGIVIVDFKSGRGKPRAPRQKPPEGETIMGKEYLSDRGHFQLDCYGLLALSSYPAAQRATLRELHLRSGEVREAVLGRDELEHVEAEIAQQMMLLDRAIAEGLRSPLARPRPGHHCLRACPVARRCPIPAEKRGVGALDSPEAADAEAGRFVMIGGLRETMRDALKAHVEETGYAPEVGDGTVIRWGPNKSGGRSFGVHPPEEPEPEIDLLAQLEAEVARRGAADGARS
jgi:hypothetical protein